MPIEINLDRWERTGSDSVGAGHSHREVVEQYGVEYDATKHEIDEGESDLRREDGTRTVIKTSTEDGTHAVDHYRRRDP